jgi:hypothetical protein
MSHRTPKHFTPSLGRHFVTQKPLCYTHGDCAGCPARQSNGRMTSKLRIATWNCNMALRLKFDRLLSLRPMWR